MAFFDTSVGGVWRSFFAAAIIAPIYALLLSIRLPLEATGSEIDPLKFWLAEGVAYVVSWVAYPVIMITVTQVLNRWDRFQAYVVAYNWSMVLQQALILPIGILAASGVISTDAGGFLWLVALALILVYIWFIARTALELAPFAAVAVVALDIALSFLISGISRGMY